MIRQQTCLECLIRSTAVCSGVPAHHLDRLNRLSFRKRYPAAGLIAGAGEDWFAILLSGVIKLTKSLPDGRHQIVALLFPSDFLGHPFRADSPYAAEAATAVDLCCFRRAPFEKLMHEQAELKQFFLERSLDEIEAMRDWVLLLGRKNAQEKVATLILMMLRRVQSTAYGTSALEDHVELELPLSRTEMADYLGLRLETVSRQLRLLRNAGVIGVGSGRTLYVRDVRALEQAAANQRR